MLSQTPSGFPFSTHPHRLKAGLQTAKPEIDSENVFGKG
jgi:hypothetical protein